MMLEEMPAGTETALPEPMSRRLKDLGLVASTVGGGPISHPWVATPGPKSLPLAQVRGTGSFERRQRRRNRAGWVTARPAYDPHSLQIMGLSRMSDFKTGDRVVVLRLDSDEIECHGSYTGERGPIMFVLPDDDDLPDPVEVGADRVFREKGQHAP